MCFPFRSITCASSGILVLPTLITLSFLINKVPLFNFLVGVTKIFAFVNAIIFCSDVFTPVFLGKYSCEYIKHTFIRKRKVSFFINTV